MSSTDQLKALIRNRSREKNISPVVLLRIYMFERLLERVSLSKYKKNFILKGGVLIASMLGVEARSTMDLDATLTKHNLTEEDVSDLITEIIEIDIDDDVEFSFKGIEEIRDAADYPGYRISLDAKMDTIQENLKVDVTTGDVITPEEIEYEYRLLLEDKTISLYAYTVETILAEKYESILTRGTLNTRMRDFYDIHMLSTSLKDKFDTGVFITALKNTAESRNAFGNISDARGIMSNISDSDEMKSLWENYQKNYDYAIDISWDRIVESLLSLTDIVT